MKAIRNFFFLLQICLRSTWFDWPPTNPQSSSYWGKQHCWQIRFPKSLIRFTRKKNLNSSKKYTKWIQFTKPTRFYSFKLWEIWSLHFWSPTGKDQPPRIGKYGWQYFANILSFFGFLSHQLHYKGKRQTKGPSS